MNRKRKVYFSLFSLICTVHTHAKSAILTVMQDQFGHIIYILWPNTTLSPNGMFRHKYSQSKEDVQTPRNDKVFTNTSQDDLLQCRHACRASAVCWKLVHVARGMESIWFIAPNTPEKRPFSVIRLMNVQPQSIYPFVSLLIKSWVNRSKDPTRKPWCETGWVQEFPN